MGCQLWILDRNVRYVFTMARLMRFLRVNMLSYLGSCDGGCCWSVFSIGIPHSCFFEQVTSDLGSPWSLCLHGDFDRTFVIALYLALCLASVRRGCHRVRVEVVRLDGTKKFLPKESREA